MLARRKNIEDIRREFECVGATLVTTVYENSHQKLEFICSVAGCNNHHYITYNAFKNGRNKNLVCVEHSRFKLPSLKYLQKEFEQKGAKLLNTEIKSTKTYLDFICSEHNCKNIGRLTLKDYRGGHNKNLLCADHLCISEKARFDKVREEFITRGVELISGVEDYKNIDSKLKFKCPKCGHIEETSFRSFKRKTNFLCKNCKQLVSKKGQKLSAHTKSKLLAENFKNERFQEIAYLMQQKGAKLLSKEYINENSRLYFICSKENCDNVHYTTWRYINKGYNKEFMCRKCLNRDKADKLRQIENLMKAKGAKLISKEYVNKFEKLDFICSTKGCNTVGHISWASIRDGNNSNFKCEKCLMGNLCNPNGIYGGNGSRRLLKDAQWYRFVKIFYNITSKDYSMHHIKPFRAYPEYRTSILNGYPLNKIVHNAAYIDEDGIKNPFHTKENYLEIINWPAEYNLIGQDFIDLENFVHTEFISTESESKESFKKKKEFEEKGILYIPLFPEEYYIDSNKKIICSMIRSKIYSSYNNIYAYTQQDHKVYYARKLYIKGISFDIARDFQERTHIQGFVPAKVYLGLYSEDFLVSVMSFGKARFGNYAWEILRFSNELNISVIGGASKLFRFFINKYNPQNVVSYCDLRFSWLSPNKTFYPKLGFKFSHYSKPSYKYLKENDYKTYSRILFQKHKLKTKIPNFDKSLSERENMSKNGYIRLYDLGNSVFVWKK